MTGNGTSESKWRFHFLLLMLMLTLLVQKSMQLRWNHPLRETVDRINQHGGPYIGLVLAFPAEERPLLASGLFVPDSYFPVVQLSGRKFNIGKIQGMNVIYVLTGEQIEFGSTDKGELKFGAYNLPRAGENLLAQAQFTPVQLFTNGKPMQELFWLPVHPHWYNLATTHLKGLKLQRCLNETLCLPKKPKVRFGLRGSTANVFLANEAYANFLHQQFNISIVDEESAAILMTSLSNGVACIVFRGVSDVAGGAHLALGGLSSLAAVNSFKVAAKFISLISREIKILAS